MSAASETAILKTDSGNQRVTVLNQYCPLNWRVQLETDCIIHGYHLKAGATDIAGESQLTRRRT